MNEKYTYTEEKTAGLKVHKGRKRNKVVLGIIRPRQLSKASYSSV